MNSKKKIQSTLVLVIVCAIVIGLKSVGIDVDEYISDPSDVVEENSSAVVDESEELEVHYIDVGQADSILIKQGSHAMLIDAGNNDDFDIIDNYLQSENVTDLEYVVATHAHEDHIGSMDDVINNYNVEKVYMAKHTATTKTFKDFVSAVSDNNLKLTVPKENETFKLGTVEFKVLTRENQKYNEVNNYSIVLKATLGDVDYLFTGDAESQVEKEILENHKEDLADIEVLKVGHHGGNTSSTANFLNAIKPEYAIISVGEGNDYGHPTDKVLKRLNNVSATVYRTDKSGTIVVSTDGENIDIETEK